ncbi:MULTISPECIES: DUF5076 domain-containing protein [unclassified Brevundimonas]|uniref:DUF5076 domain-containing protein n=1 Tax=unclassified Brevundimonas TaxID=2622653 RepID=UPI000CFAEB5E|nr:DUF5076 domain-containing protein [Brevundimonas sp. MYb31]PRA31963.1 DUF5076 domain-containing protein [Brevundimonas sp. MYb27]PRB17012.1 DUF5076 domain-containing protein [Brevundimonas sp. MYb52]PRB37274.1 DUF5076 domain-containing protein [Brevundimonas sp. MYb46]PRB48443.1 DUF5076 domain-containing protein [Brevundimonas sp. MYb33]
MKELSTPSLAAAPNAVEVLRVWAAEGSPQQFTLQPTWDDPAAWGLLLADLARHAARAYAANGRSETEAFERVLAGLRAELDNPTER